MRLSYKLQDESALRHFVTSLKQNGLNGEALLSPKEPNSAGAIRNSSKLTDKIALSQDGIKKPTLVKQQSHDAYDIKSYNKPMLAHILNR